MRHSILRLTTAVALVAAAIFAAFGGHTGPSWP